MKKTQHRYVGFWPRLLAHNIDLLPILILFYMVSFFIPKSNFDYLMISGIYLIYHVGFETLWQATPGKKWMKICVKNTNGKRINIFHSLLRNSSKFLSLILFFGGFMLISFNPQKRGLHDFIGGALVLFQEDEN